MELRLNENAIGDIGAQVLCDMLATKDTLPKLEVFTLSNNNISDDMYDNLYATARLNDRVYDIPKEDFYGLNWDDQLYLDDDYDHFGVEENVDEADAQLLYKLARDHDHPDENDYDYTTENAGTCRDHASVHCVVRLLLVS